jgi:enoyl-CoA hydratase
MSFENLLLERDGAVAVLTINRPTVLNALDSKTLDELHDVFLELGNDASARAIVLTGSGNKAFVAGADIRELARLGPIDGAAFARRGQQTFDAIETLGKPVIAAVGGFALGGGCELAMACTLRIASETARFGQPEINLGLIPGYAGTQRLPRLVGKGVALDILLTGRQIDAREALQIGLVNRVVPSGELLAEARKLATTLAGSAPHALRCIIQAVNEGGETTLERGQSLEAALFGLTAATDDKREGTAAFLEKRQPVFTGS